MQTTALHRKHCFPPTISCLSSKLPNLSQLVSLLATARNNPKAIFKSAIEASSPRAQVMVNKSLTIS
jgi:hypothetical protein